MRSAGNIKRLVKNAKVKIDQDVKKASLDELVNELENTKIAGSVETESNILALIARSKITQIAALFIVLSSICLLMYIFCEKERLGQHETTLSQNVEISPTPAELVSAITLNMAFKDGGMQAMEKKFEKAEKKVKSGLKTNLTIEELLCELNGC